MSFFISLFPPELQGFMQAVTDVWHTVWWIVTPLITGVIFWQFWRLYLKVRFIRGITWKLLEIRVPKDVVRTPKAMEQIFAAAHAPYSYGLRFLEKYWEGKHEYWMSFELVGRAGEVHFYLRLPSQYRNLMESAIYAQYPDAEIIEPQTDYAKEVPRVLPNKTYDLYGAELILKNPDPFPIRTYPMFEEIEEEKRVDPIALIIEAMSRLKSDEQIWIQVLVEPTGDAWRNEGEKIINKITGLGEAKPKRGILGDFADSLTEAFGAFTTAATDSVREVIANTTYETVEGKRKDEKEKNLYGRMLVLTPGQKEQVEAIDRKTAKLGFHSTVRFIYIDRRDAFSRDNVAAVMGNFRQFNTQNLNLFRPDKKTMTAAIHWMFKPTRMRFRKRVIYEKYKDMSFNHHKPILNIEELATIYHFPITGVSAPMLQRLESKRGGPPLTLPLVE